MEALDRPLTTIVDLGCGDGRLISLVLDAHPELASAIGVDNSPPMLELARQQFAADQRVTIVEHDLDRSLPDVARVDAVVSGFAIHHLTHERKRTLFGEIAAALQLEVERIRGCSSARLLRPVGWDERNATLRGAIRLREIRSPARQNRWPWFPDGARGAGADWSLSYQPLNACSDGNRTTTVWPGPTPSSGRVLPEATITAPPAAASSGPTPGT